MPRCRGARRFRRTPRQGDQRRAPARPGASACRFRDPDTALRATSRSRLCVAWRSPSRSGPGFRPARRRARPRAAAPTPRAANSRARRCGTGTPIVRTRETAGPSRRRRTASRRAGGCPAERGRSGPRGRPRSAAVARARPSAGAGRTAARRGAPSRHDRSGGRAPRPRRGGEGGHPTNAMNASRTPGQSLRARILGGETLFGAWAGLGSPMAAELMGRAGYDWVLIDLEHGAGTEADLLAHLNAVEVTPAAALVRPQSGERLRIGRALDLGAAGVVIPRLDSTAEVREAVSYLRYPPAGGRGVALMTRGARLGTVGHGDVGDVNRDIVGIVQVESPGALRDAAEIAAIDGVDVLFVGPADLSHSLGVPGQFGSETYLGALHSVVEACRANGKAAGILLYDPASFAPHLEMGFTFVGLGADASFVAGGAASALSVAKGT